MATKTPPIVRLPSRSSLQLFAKLEGGHDPYGAVKAKPARFILDDELRRVRHKHIWCASSGSFACAVALYCAEKRIRCTVVVNEKIPPLKLSKLREFGANIIQCGTCTLESHNHALNMVKESAGEYYYVDQLNDPRAVLAHQQITAREIFNSLQQYDCIVCSAGSGATCAGIRRALEDTGYRANILYTVNGDPQKRGITGTYLRSVDLRTPFIVEIEEIGLTGIPITWEEADSRMRWLYEQGISVGRQGGGVYAAMERVAQTMGYTKMIGVMGDSAEPYL